MLNDSLVQVAPKGSRKVTQLGKSVAIGEEIKGDRLRWQASPDRLNWGNGTDSKLGFLVALGCREEEISGGAL